MATMPAPGRDSTAAAAGPSRTRGGEHRAAHRTGSGLPTSRGKRRRDQDHDEHHQRQEQFVGRSERLDGPFLAAAGVRSMIGRSPPRCGASARDPSGVASSCVTPSATAAAAIPVAHPRGHAVHGTQTGTRTPGVTSARYFANKPSVEESEHGDQRQEGRRHRRCVRFGRASAELLASKGAKVAVLDREGTDGTDVANAIGGTFRPST